MKDESGKVVFDQEEQAEVDRVVEERLARERSKYADYNDLKEVDAILAEFGYQGSTAERKAVLKQQAEELKKQQELEQAKRDAAMDPTTKTLKEVEDLKKELAEIKSEKQKAIQEEESKKKQAEDAAKQIKDFEETYPDIDLEKLNKDEDFIDFLSSSNPNLSLAKVYEKYQKFVGGAESKAIEKIKSNVERSTSSGREKGDGGSYGLSAEQKAAVDEWNRKNPRLKMTYKEYASRL